MSSSYKKWIGEEIRLVAAVPKNWGEKSAINALAPLIPRHTYFGIRGKLRQLRNQESIRVQIRKVMA